MKNNFKDEYIEVDPDELLSALCSSVKDDNKKDFMDIVNLSSYLNREVYLGDISEGVGVTIEGIIRFWNILDNKCNIPIEERQPIKIYIDSNGGCLNDCLTICDSIKMSKTPVWTIVVGSAYSSAFDICTFGHKRFAYPHATFLFHEGSTGISGTVNQFQNYASFNKKLIQKTRDYLIANTNITEEKYNEVQRDDWWLDAEEALEWGVIDEIVEEFV